LQRHPFSGWAEARRKRYSGKQVPDSKWQMAIGGWLLTFGFWLLANSDWFLMDSEWLLVSC
jgi:hypothetical protein